MKSELERSLHKVNKAPKKQYNFTDKEYKKAADFMQQIKSDCAKALSISK